MAQDPANLGIVPKTIVPICSDPQLDLLPSICIQAQQLWMFVGSELSKQAHCKLVLLHNVDDSRVSRQTLQHRAGRFGVWEVRKGFNAMEAVAEVAARRRAGIANLTVEC
jgi:hypothetical protein